MFTKNQKVFMVRVTLLLVLCVGMFGIVHATVGAAGNVPQVQIITPTYPIGMKSGENKLVGYKLQETANVSGKITSKSVQFFTQYDVPLSELMGPYSTNIQVNALSTTNWDESISLPANVVDKARSMNKFTIVLKTTFSGTSTTGTKFSAKSSLLLLLPPDSFGKSSPTDGEIVSLDNLSLQWNSSVGATDYEYCFDTIDNNSCDTQWTGTYWLSTYDTVAKLKNLPDRTFYWQVRATNLAGKVYADNGKWWSFHVCNNPDNRLITVKNINDAGPGSLRQAITNVCPGGTITFAQQLSGQTIHLESYIGLSKILTIDGSNLNQNVRLDGSSNVSSLMITRVDTNSKIILKGLDFLNATYSGVAHYDGVLHIYNCSFTGNELGILNEERLTVTNSIFSNNSTGVVNWGVLQVTHSSFSNNNAGIDNEKLFLPYSPFSTLGEATVNDSDFIQNRMGGIQNIDGTLTVKNSRFSGNQADQYGGGIQNWGTSTVALSQFTNNSAQQSGGGIFNGGALILTQNTFLGNSTGETGGGVFNYGAMASTDNTFINNKATNSGGGIFTSGFDLQMTNNTFYNNSAAQGGGLYFDSETYYEPSVFINNTLSTNAGGNLYINKGNLRLFSNIFANSKDGFDCFDSNATILEGENNLIENDASSPYTCGMTSTTSDPLLQVPADNGGVTQTMALAAGSPAIDSGYDMGCPTADQRGITRPQGGHCDIGAYEYVVIVPKHPVLKSEALTPSLLNIQTGATDGASSNLNLLDQTGTNDDPAAYVSFQTPDGPYLGDQSFSLPQGTQAKLVSTMLLQLNVKAPASSTQVWTWSIYNWNTKMWIEIGDTIGLTPDQWQEITIRIRQPQKYVSPGNEIRIQLTSKNTDGNLKVDYAALHVTYLSLPVRPTLVSSNMNSDRPSIFSVLAAPTP